MSSFSPRVAGSSVTRPDPAKHVNYSLGMVLGVDDFTQEFAYLSGRDQWLARDLVGYGTVSGLAVSVAYDANDRGEVVITPGAALGPRGQLIRVTPTQCADLGDWIAQERNRERLGELPEGTTTLPLYVVLSYRECATDDVPIPGEPCRSEEDSMEASRLADNFRLELSFDPPDQREEEALRDFVQWLSQWAVVGDESGGTFATLEQFERAVRRGSEIPSPPPSPPDYMYGSPPGTLRVRSSDACEFLRAALRIWVTELRPLWGGAGQTAGLPPNEEGVLLAELSVPIRKTVSGDRWELQHPGVAKAAVDETRRPFVLHLRMLQEWVECGSRLPTPGDFVTEERRFGLPAAPGTSQAYSRADHTHGTPDLVGDAYIGGDGRTVVGSLNGIPVIPSASAPPIDGQVLLYASNRWVGGAAPPIPLAGDVTGSSDDNELNALKGVPFIYNEGAARQGQVLTYVLVETGEEGGGGEGGGGSEGGAASESSETVEGEDELPSPDDEIPPPPSPPSSPPSPTLRPVWMPADLTIQGATIRQPDAETPLADGQVLTFRQPLSPVGEGQWEAMPLPPVTLNGDVEGSTDATTVRKIQGEPVADFASATPQHGELLTYSVSEDQPQGMWVSQPPADLAGDVVGPRGETSVRRLYTTDLIDFSIEGNHPQAGEVLTWVVPEETTPGRWQARPPAASGVTLGGDLAGTPDAAKVAGLRGTAVADFARDDERPDNGDLLVYVVAGSPPTGRWRALPAGGDVSGPATDSVVNRIRRVPVGVRDGATPFNEGDVLVFRGGAWRPEALPQPDEGGGGTTTSTEGSFVERPANEPPYSIVAAGVVAGDGVSRGPVYGGLNIRLVDTGTITVTFNGYQFPGDAFQYIVKAMPVVNPEVPRSRSMVVVFDRFLRSEGLGFVLRVTNLGQDVSADELKNTAFMIEVSHYEASKG